MARFSVTTPSVSGGGDGDTPTPQTRCVLRRIMGSPPPHGALAFALVYLTFFLDNVLLTVLVPIIPDWIRGESLALWSRHDAPLAAFLNDTLRRATDDSPGAGGMQAVVGVVLGAKAGAQLAAAPLCSVAVCRHGPAPVLRAATTMLAAAAATLGICGTVGGGAWCVGLGRAAQGAGAAGAGVAGLALAAAAVGPETKQRALGALLGAVALGVLVGYPFGGMANALWHRAVPFFLISGALVADLAMQNMFLDREEFRQRRACGGGWAGGGWRGVAAAARGAGGACAGAVLLTTAVMAALEPCLPLYIDNKFHPKRWQMGMVFVPDSAGYLVAATLAGGVARRVGAERVALVAQFAVGVAALAIPHAPSVWWLAVPHLTLGLGLGACDAALVPALAARRPRSLPHLAALLQAAASVAYTLGPVLGGLASWGVGFAAAVRALGAANLLYAAFLYRALKRHPLSEQWGAGTPDEDEDDEGDIPLAPGEYGALE